jgi:hypothetical protein
MLAGEVPESLRLRLGGDGTEGLLEVLERTREESVTAAMTACGDRFERRLVETSAGLRLELHDGLAALRLELRDGLAAVRQELRDELAAVRQELHHGLAAVRQELAEQRADQLKWAFLFWVGQVAAIAGLLAVFLRAIA